MVNYITHVVFFTLAFALTSCSTLMVSEHRIDGNRKLKLKSGDSLKIEYQLEPGIEEQIADILPPADFKALLKEKTEALFTERGVEIQPSSKNKMIVTVKEFEPGSGIGRLIGMWGNSYLTIKIDFKKGKKLRVFELRKDGQISGMGALGDQTFDNVEYVATKLAGSIVK